MVRVVMILVAVVVAIVVVLLKAVVEVATYLAVVFEDEFCGLVGCVSHSEIAVA